MRIPTNCQFEITERCNEGCDYCYNSFRDYPTEERYNSDAIAKRIADNGIFYTVITGGEPFVVKDRLLRSCKIFQENNMDFSINTNLTLVTEEDIKILKEFGITSFLTSVVSFDWKIHDATKKRAGAFDRLMRGIDLVRRSDIHLAANMVMTQVNKNQVYDTGKYLYEKFGGISFCATPLMPTPDKDTGSLAISNKDYIKGLDGLLQLNNEFGMSVDSLCPPLPCLFYDQQRYATFLRRSCVGGRTTFTVSSDGQIRPCSHSVEKYGNILDDDLHILFPKMRKWQDSGLIPDSCNDCAYKHSCRGGCRVSAMAFSNDLRGKHPYFQQSIKEPKPVKHSKPFEYAQIMDINGKVRYRPEQNGSTTVYLNPHVTADLNERQLGLFRVLRAYSRKSLREIEQDLNIDKDFFERSVVFFEKNGLIQLVKE